MENSINRIKAWTAALVGLLTGLWGWFGWLVVGWVVCMVLANLPVLALPVQYPGLVCPVVLVWYIVTELGSMTENAAVMGAPVPKWLVKLLALSKSAVDSAGESLSAGDDHEQ